MTALSSPSVVMHTAHVPPLGTDAVLSPLFTALRQYAAVGFNGPVYTPLGPWGPTAALPAR